MAAYNTCLNSDCWIISTCICPYRLKHASLQCLSFRCICPEIGSTLTGWSCSFKTDTASQATSIVGWINCCIVVPHICAMCKYGQTPFSWHDSTHSIQIYAAHLSAPLNAFVAPISFSICSFREFCFAMWVASHSIRPLYIRTCSLWIVDISWLAKFPSCFIS